MWTPTIALLLAAAIGAVSGQEGSFWAIYDIEMGPANSTCLVTEGDMVDEDCCMDAGQMLEHSDLAGNYTCFVLGEDLIPFSGCVGDGIAGYGENCVGEGAPFVANDADECGCAFQIEGSGCYKANDIPGQQWFVYLDGGACTDGNETDMGSMAPTATPTPAPSGAFEKGMSLAFGLMVAAMV